MIRKFLDKKNPRGFLPFYFVGEKPSGVISFFHLEAQYNVEGF